MTDRVSAAVVGALFIVATAAGMVGLTLQEAVLGGDDYLLEASAQEGKLVTGVVLQLVMGLAVVGIAVVIYPVLRRQTERLAVGYVVARVIEGLIYVASATGILALITLSKDYAASAGTAAGDSSLPVVGDLILAQRDWSGHGILDAAVFSVGALVLNAALYHARLVPRWLAVFGLLGAVAYLSAGVWVLYGLEPLSSPQVALEAPLGVQEMVLALWLIIKGFSPGRIDHVVARWAEQIEPGRPRQDSNLRPTD